MLFYSLLSCPSFFIFFVISITVSLTIHEFSHAWVANRLGDSTPKLMGRLSLNPIVHLDLFGTIFLFLVGFGWGKPVMINPRNFANPALDNLTVSLAGPFSNLFLAIVLGLIVRFVPLPSILQFALETIVFYNLIFMIFNLLPIPPLDGSKILGLFLSEEAYLTFQQFGIFILFGLIVFSSYIPVIPFIINKVVFFFFNLATGLSPIEILTTCFRF